MLFLAARGDVQFLCNFIPLKNQRKKARNAVFKKYLREKIVMLDEVDTHIPHEVLTQINIRDNQYFYSLKSQDI